MSSDVEVLTVGQEYDLIIQVDRFVRLNKCRFQGARKEGLYAFLVPQQKGMVTPEMLIISIDRIATVSIPGGTLVDLLSPKKTTVGGKEIEDQ